MVSFLTLSLTAFVFLVAVYTLDKNSHTIFSYVEQTIQTNTRSSDLYRMLVTLELDIRELINIILREPYKLVITKESLQEQFERIRKKAAEGVADPLQQKLLKQLQWYRTSLDRLLWYYGEVNSVLYEVYFYINNIKEQLAYMEEAAGKIMVDLALEGRNTEALQQSYVLVNIAREKILQINIMINSSIANNRIDLLVTDKQGIGGDEDTAIGKLHSLKNTLRTLTASEEAIANYAANIQQTIPLLQDNILDLSVKFENLNEHQRLFVIERDQTMKMLEGLEDQNRSRILSINNLLIQLSQKTRLSAWLIALAVMFISVIGLILTRRMSGQLENTAEEALLSREAAESLNTQLQQEVIERQRIAEELSEARDKLELRVRERTAELSIANRGLALEVEERKSAEDALASEKEQLAVTLRSIGDGVITTGLQGEVILLNKVAEQLTGWSVEEAAGRPLREIFHIVCKESGDPCENPIDILMKNGRIYNLADDTVLIARDGKERDISDSCAPIRDRESRIIGAVLVFRDVTEKKKMQDEALKSEKLKSVGVLAGGIAHDFNNILAAILGNISLARIQLEKRQDGKDPLKLLEGAEKASLRARNLTQQLLTFSKGGEPVKKVESIGSVIKDSADFILSGGKVHCEYKFDDDVWPVNIDAGQMSQVVQNIIINAMDAMPEGGKIEISCTNFFNAGRVIPALPEEEYVRISIRDEGEGIPQKLMDRIFDPYFTTKKEGSGLGLALTHSIIFKHHGYIEVNSGQWGTEFIIYLPALPGHTVEGKANIVQQVSGRAQGRILIMDDEPMVRDIAGELLVHLGYNVSVAKNGEEAVAMYRERMGSDAPFDAVIMDLTIPGGMGGKEAIQKLQEIDPAVRGIVSSGYSNDPVMAEYEKYGFAGMVHKPFEVDELIGTLSRVIGQGRTSGGSS